MKTAFVFLGIRINIASRARRRWLVAILYAAFGVLDVLWFRLAGKPFVGLLLLAALMFLARFLGGRTYQGGLIPSYEGGDERERTRRYRASYLAYNYVDLAFLPAILFAFAQNGPEARRGGPAVHLLFANMTWGMFAAAVILYYTLPQAILLCSEPDIEEA
jgi:hypothetical protein